jgi:hypothetical protein
MGIVYRDEHVGEATAAQKLLADYAPTAKATQDLAGISQAVLAQFPQRNGNARAAVRPGWLRRPSR